MSYPTFRRKKNSKNTNYANERSKSKFFSCQKPACKNYKNYCFIFE